MHSVLSDIAWCGVTRCSVCRSGWYPDFSNGSRAYVTKNIKWNISIHLSIRMYEFVCNSCRWTKSQYRVVCSHWLSHFLLLKYYFPMLLSGPIYVVGTYTCIYVLSFYSSLELILLGVGSWDGVVGDAGYTPSYTATLKTLFTVF